jgi:hypothetical protein
MRQFVKVQLFTCPVARLLLYKTFTLISLQSSSKPLHCCQVGLELGVATLQPDTVALALVGVSSLVVRAHTHLSRNVTIESAEIRSVRSTAGPAMCA